MGGIDCSSKQFLNFAESLGFGHYRISTDGVFKECDTKAREIFGISQNLNDVSQYSYLDFFKTQPEKALQLKRLKEENASPQRNVMTLLVKGELKFIHEICMYTPSNTGDDVIVGLVSEVENSSLFSSMLHSFPLGAYELEQDGKIVWANKQLADIFKYSHENALKKTPIENFCEDKNKLAEFDAEITVNGVAQKILKVKNAENKIIDIQCSSQVLNESNKARWGIVSDVTDLMRYKNAVERMPTGFYQIEGEKITQCNDWFAKIIGVGTKEKAIGMDVRGLFLSDEDHKKYKAVLLAADKKGKALQLHPLDIKRVDDEKIITISVDSHLLKDSAGKVIGRVGTIRDITDKIELEKKVNETEEHYKKTTTDVNKLIHTFLHPVVKASGHAELLSKLGHILKETVYPKTVKQNSKTLSKKLLAEITSLKNRLPDIEEKDINITKKRMINKEKDLLALVTLKSELAKLINTFHYIIYTEKSGIQKENALKDASLKVLEELYKANYSKRSSIAPFVREELVELVQSILFDYLVQSASVLLGETGMMKRRVEAIRSYIGFKPERTYGFYKCDIGKILEENIKQFTPVLADDNIEIDYQRKGNLLAEVSKNDLDRVICNLFHNAKKYSSKGGRRFLKIIAREVPRSPHVMFSLESYGIPIKKEEIDSGDIWEFGYRGKLAFKSDKDGTGVGLADTKDVVEAHSGEVTLTSIPKIHDGDPPEYRVPYVTTITITLPRKQPEKSKGIKYENRQSVMAGRSAE